MPLTFDFGKGIQSAVNAAFPQRANRRLQEKEQAGIQGSRDINDILNKVKAAGGPQTPGGQLLMQDLFKSNPQMQALMQKMGGKAFGGGGALGGIPPAREGFKLGGYSTDDAGQVSSARFQPTEKDPLTSSDAEFYTKKGYTPEDAQAILDKKFGLDRGSGSRTRKEIATEIGKWQSILNRTREVGVLGTFGEIYDQNTFDLAEKTIAELKGELGGQDQPSVSPSLPVGTSQQPPASSPQEVQIPAPLGDVDAVTGADRKAPSTKVKMRNKKGAVFNVIGKEVSKWEKKGFVAEDGLTRDKRGWVHFKSPEGIPMWVNPKDIKIANDRGFVPIK